MSDEYLFCPFRDEECRYGSCQFFSVDNQKCGIAVFIENNLGVVQSQPVQQSIKIANPETNIILELEEYSHLLTISVDLSTVTVIGGFIKEWSQINDILKPLNYGWSSTDKSWILGYVAPPRDANTDVKQTPKEVEWKRNSKNTGDYTFSDKMPELAKEIQEHGPWYTKDGYTYSLFGDTNELGYPKMIGRKKAKAKSK